MLSDLLDKLTSYNLFNYLLPGAVFAFIAEINFGLSLVPQDLVTAAFLYYFLGVVISRLGSIFIEPLLKKIRLVELEPYKSFLKASEKDPKIEVLVEAANMYRTFVSAFLLLLLMATYFKTESSYPFLIDWRMPLGGLAMLALFLCSYIKQSNYIVRRIRKANK